MSVCPDEIDVVRISPRDEDIEWAHDRRQSLYNTQYGQAVVVDYG